MKLVSVILISALFTLSSIARNLPNPPSMPSLTAKNKDDACKIIPPMLVHLPPMLEKDLDKCKNSLYKPSINLAEKKLHDLLKRGVKVYKVTIVKGFSMLYKIESDDGDFYCNRYVDRCLTSSLKVIE